MSTAAERKIKNSTQSWLVLGDTFEIDTQYRVIDYLGAGAYGVVCSAQDQANGNKLVAIKKCKKLFQSHTMAKRILREIRLLRLINHDNVVKIVNILKPTKNSEFTDIYIVFEIMETDLAQIIRSQQVLRDEHVQYFIYQVVKAMEYLHSLNIVHRDLKPRNLLVNGNCMLKVADFGLARIYDDISNNKTMVPMTEYVTTRWYRAPEILVGWSKYSAAVDMWAVGTILAELLGRSPIFPGGDSVMQIDLIVQKLGTPSEQFIQQCRKPSYRQYLRQHQQNRKPCSLSELYPHANTKAVHLLKKLLKYQPPERLVAHKALQDPYLSSVNNSPKETHASLPLLNIDEFWFDNSPKASLLDYRVEMLKEVLNYHSAENDPQASSITKYVQQYQRKGSPLADSNSQLSDTLPRVVHPPHSGSIRLSLRGNSNQVPGQSAARESNRDGHSPKGNPIKRTQRKDTHLYNMVSRDENDVKLAQSVHHTSKESEPNVTSPSMFRACYGSDIAIENEENKSHRQTDPVCRIM